MSFWNKRLTPFQHVLIVALLSVFVIAEIVARGSSILGFAPETGILIMFSLPAIVLVSIMSLLVRPQYINWHEKGVGWLFVLLNAIAAAFVGMVITYAWMANAS